MPTSEPPSRSAWPHLVAIALSLFIGCATVLAVRQARRWRGYRDFRVVRQGLPVRSAAVCVVAAVLTSWIPAQSQAGRPRVMAFVLGSLAVALTISSLLAVVLSFVGRVVARFGHRAGSAAALLGGRSLQLFPARASRVMLGVCGAILVLGQVQLWTGSLSLEYRDAVALRAWVAGRVVEADNAPYGPQLADYLRGLSGAAPVWTWLSTENPRHLTVVVSGSCRAMQVLGRTCNHPDTNTQPGSPLLAAFGGGTAELTFDVNDATDMKQLARHGANQYLVSTGGSGLPVDQTAAAGLPAGPRWATARCRGTRFR